MSKVYSLPLRQWVYESAVAKVMAQPFGDPERFFDHCVNLFPVVMAPADPSEIAGLRAIADWHPDPEGRHHSLKANVDALIRPHAVWPKRSSAADKEQGPIPARGLPYHIAGVPLIARWLVLGQMCHGTDSFSMPYPQILKRRGFGTENVIGAHIHSDATFQDGYTERYLSIFTAAAEEALMPFSQCQPDKPGPAWATHWVDMRHMSLNDYLRIDGRFYQPEVADLLADTCTLTPMPAGMHVALPTFMLHKAGGRHSPRGNQNGDVIIAHCVTSNSAPAAATAARTLKAG